MFVAAPRSTASALTVPVVLGATDPGSSRLVYAMVIGLVVIGVALVVLGIWIIRQTRPDLPVLAPLERMGDRDWKKRDPATQRRMLDELRPAGAEPLAAQAPPPPLDAEFEQAEHPVPSLSDLGPGVLADEDSTSGPEEDSASDHPSDSSASDAAEPDHDVEDAVDVEDAEVAGTDDDVDDVETAGSDDEVEVVEMAGSDDSVAAEAVDEFHVADELDDADDADDADDLVADRNDETEVDVEPDVGAENADTDAGDDDERVDDSAAEPR